MRRYRSVADQLKDDELLDKATAAILGNVEGVTTLTYEYNDVTDDCDLVVVSENAGTLKNMDQILSQLKSAGIYEPLVSKVLSITPEDYKERKKNGFKADVNEEGD